MRPISLTELLLIFILVIMLFMVFGCASSSNPLDPIAEVITKPVEPARPQPKLSDITDLAVGSSCSKVNWNDRGVSRIGYFKGMTLVYAKAVCEADRADVMIAGAKPSGDSQKDVLTHYGLKPENALRTTYQLLIGLGMRESSGRYCVGRDAAASNLDSETAEAGLWQTSYNSRLAHPILKEMYAKYKGSPDGCYLDTFKEGFSQCSAGNLKNHGTGEGVNYQKLNKECPGFAAEYTSVMIRKAYRHYGPLRTKAAQLVPVCGDMLKMVEAKVKENPDICNIL